MKRSLKILEGIGQGDTELLTSEASAVLVGRGEDADIRLHDPRVSRGHVCLQIRNQTAFAKNKSSRGFKHNGQLHTGESEVRLASGDVLTLGNTKLRYEEVEESLPTPTTPPSALADDSDVEETRMADPADLARLTGGKTASGQDQPRTVELDASRLQPATPPQAIPDVSD